MRIVSFLSVSLFCAAALADVKIEGRLVEKGTRLPLAGYHVFVLPAKLKAVTDKDGNFAIEAVPAGETTIVVNAAGYEKLERAIAIGDAAPAPLKLYLKKVSYDVYETTIYDRADKRDEKTKVLDTQAFSKLPGSNGDPVKAVQNLPGVNRPNSFSSQVIIEGSAPQDTKYTVDGHDVPIIFHLGGFSSIAFPEAIERVEYLSSGYGPEYGDAMAGVVGLWLRSPKRDRMHGFAFVDFFNSGLMLESPAGESGGVMLAARQSYIGFVFKALFKGNSSFDLTTVPSFTDGSIVYERDLGKNDKFRLVTIGSLDSLGFLFESPVSKDNTGRGTIEFDTKFFRLIPEWSHKHEDGATTRASLSIGKDWLHQAFNEKYLDRNDWDWGLRGEHERKLTDEWSSILGIDTLYTQANVDFVAPTNIRSPGTQGGQGASGLGTVGIYPSSRETTTYYATDVGLYWRNQIHAEDSPWTFLPHLRFDYFTILHETAFQPRAAVRYQLAQGTTLRAATGLYAQQPEGQMIDRAVGNPDLKSQRAYHATLGVQQDFRAGATEGFILSSDFFYKYLERLAIGSSDFVVRDGLTVPERYNNKGTGHAYGWQAMLSLRMQPVTGWLSYTLSRSTRREPGEGEHLFQYDQTHILTAIAQVELGRNWYISGRMRYTTGNPYTSPTGAVFDGDTDSYSRILGDRYNSRFGPFFTLDMRVDKKWVFDDWILSAYLDVQNTTNRENPESINYSYDYSRTQIVSQLPILPAFGLRGEF